MVRAGSMVGVGVMTTGTAVAAIGSTEEVSLASAPTVGVTILVTVSSRVLTNVSPSLNDVVR